MSKNLEGKIFTIGPDQILRYDDTLKSLLGYISEKYDQRVISCIHHKDKSVEVKLLVKPSVPTKLGPAEANLTVLNKDGEQWIMYQLQLKKYIDRATKLDDDIQQIFSIILGQYSPGMEQTLLAIKGYNLMKEEVDSIKLIKNIEKIYYNYQPYEYPPFGSWEALDTLGKAIQLDKVFEADHYETVKTMVEVCKASGVNFPMLCIHTVNMAMNMLHTEGEIFQTGKYKDSVYFRLNENKIDLVNDRVDEIYIATKLLSLSSNKKVAASKQELRNYLIKGKDNYPRTVIGVLK